MPEDPVNPTHYHGDAVMGVIEEFDLGFCLGNTVKYILRAGKKVESSILVDLEKARWYLEREIMNLKTPPIVPQTFVLNEQHELPRGNKKAKR